MRLTMMPLSSSSSSSHLSLSTLTRSTLLLSLIILTTTSPDSSSDDQRKALGENKFQELQEKTVSSSCWKDAVARLNTTCKRITDVEQSRLAVAFANCHLAKSGRQVYHCSDTITIQECTGDMDTVAFQTCIISFLSDCCAEDYCFETDIEPQA